MRQPRPANRLFAAIDDAATGEPLGKPSAPPDRRRTRSIEPLEPRRVLDSTVVFNEVMYNPPGPTDDALEWIELSNQMAVDMDLSGWRLDGGVEFEFPFNVRFHPDALFRGVHESVAIDRSGRGGTASQTQDEILIKHITNASGSIGGMYDDLVRFIAPNPVHTRTALLMMARFGDEFLDTQFEDGGEGTVFKLDIAYVPNGTTNGNPQSPKLPVPYHHPPAKDLADFGDDKEAYRRHLLIRNNRAADDYSGIIAVSQALSLSGAALAERIDQVIDVDQWMRTFAIQSLTGVADTYTRGGLHHNISFYIRPSDGRAVALPWDWDFAFTASTSGALVGPVSNTNKVMPPPTPTRSSARS